MDYAARLADSKDPLLRVLRAARSWRVAPTVIMGRTVSTTYEYDRAGRVVRAVTDGWTSTDTEMVLALEVFEAGLCPGCQHPLEETSRTEHEGAYQPEPPVRCHYCTAQALISETAKNPAGLLYPITLNPDLVELNKQPIPPLPPELQQDFPHADRLHT